METKTLVILANSIKNQGRCVAGRLWNPTIGAGQWIRPVSAVGEGVLLPHHYTLPGGRVAHPLDVIEIPLETYRPAPGQPENWLVSEGVAWRAVSALGRRHVAALTEHPADLWLEPSGHSDRISLDAQARRTPQSSLTLIEPEGFQVHTQWEDVPQRDGRRLRRRGVFRFRGVTYELSITDPSIEKRYHLACPAADEPPQDCALACGDHCRLCVSLTPPFHGFHYKVIAAVLEC